MILECLFYSLLMIVHDMTHCSDRLGSPITHIIRTHNYSIAFHLSFSWYCRIFIRNNKIHMNLLIPPSHFFLLKPLYCCWLCCFEYCFPCDSRSFICSFLETSHLTGDLWDCTIWYTSIWTGPFYWRNCSIIWLSWS
jgi:hypothetical protein